MADKCHLCLLGLIFLSSLLTGLSEVDDDHVFISSGEDVRLPCNNALPDCKSTTWNYNSYSSAVELVAGGRKKTDRERHERLSLGSDCSLNIKSVTKEDYGLYTCRQYVNNQQQVTDASVFVHVLHVSSSEISAGRSVTLYCQLYSYPRVSCDDLIRSEGIDLFWMNQAGVKQMRLDSRNQISAPGHCITSLNTTILNENENREWRCVVTQRDQLKTSVSYTVKISVIVIIVEFAVFAAPTVILLQIICAGRADLEKLLKHYLDVDESSQMAIAETVFGIFVIRQEGAESGDDPADVGIVLEGVEVMSELGNVAFAVVMLLGLVYALNLSYPQELKYTFEVLQKIIMELDGNKGQVLKTLLSRYETSP
ncbi:uncharacterized protein LOC113097008 [Carassius auratus]|uniref:Uncharacterized protein LOC113097008 n=1 Tax=Carassius auratus TaxID=7957 RepID=A0A6P6PAH2_CARAU|nr:uncharacterized protein LOC113097008 [Carassius auratus]